MANVQHSSLTDSDGIHEPKGITDANSGEVYVADGNDSGNWRASSNIPGTGWAKYTNQTYITSGATTTALAIPANTETTIPFDTASNVAQLPITLSGTTSSLMDLPSERLLFVNTNDLHTITFTAEIFSFTSTGPSHMDIYIHGSSDGSTYSTILASTTTSFIKGAGQIITETFLLPVTANMVSYGAKLRVKTPNTGTSTNLINISLITARVHKVRS